MTQVLEAEKKEEGRWRYMVHYNGWNSRYDEWVTNEVIVCLVDEAGGDTAPPPQAGPTTYKTKPGVSSPVRSQVD